MSVAFGLPVGDFVAALEVVPDVVDTLYESGEAGIFQEVLKIQNLINHIPAQMER